MPGSRPRGLYRHCCPAPDTFRLGAAASGGGKGAFWPGAFATGALGVLGPTRMPYGRAISAVRYVADLMSDLVSDLYSR